MKSAPKGDRWIHEVKFDGFRIGAAIEHGRASLLSRRSKDWTAEFASVAAGAERLKAKRALLDGEAAAVLSDGRTSMHGMNEGSTIFYFVFDLLHLNGEDLTGRPIEERKDRLRDLLGKAPPAPLRYVDHVVGEGPAFFKEACRHRLEGIISKAAGSTYRPGARNATWQKVKCLLRQEFVIGGYEYSTVGGLGAIWLGYYLADGSLEFAGKVGTGFQRDSASLLEAFKKIERDTSPFGAGLPTGFRIREAIRL